MSNNKSRADLFFEQYLSSQGLCDFEYEKDWENTTVHPDYSVFRDDLTYIFEVKELDPRPSVSGFAFIDPYRNIRAKIHEVVSRKQFKPFKNKFPCCLVLWSSDNPHQLLDPIRMGGAMYGDVGIKAYFDPNTGESPDKESENVFNKRGKMIRPGEKEPQNTTFSALISLSAYPIGRLWEQLKDRFDSTELTEMNLFETNDTNLVIPGVTVWENGFAQMPFPRGMFNGPFDHRYVNENGYFELHEMGKAWEMISSMQPKL